MRYCAEMHEGHPVVKTYSIISAAVYALLMALCAFLAVFVLIDTGLGLLAALGALLAALFSWWLVMVPRDQPSVWRHAWLGFFTGILSPVILAIVVSGPAAPVVAWPAIVALGVPAAVFAIPVAILFGGLAKSGSVTIAEDRAAA